MHFIHLAIGSALQRAQGRAHVAGLGVAGLAHVNEVELGVDLAVLIGGVRVRYRLKDFRFDPALGVFERRGRRVKDHDVLHDRSRSGRRRSDQRRGGVGRTARRVRPADGARIGAGGALRQPAFVGLEQHVTAVGHGREFVQFIAVVEGAVHHAGNDAAARGKGDAAQRFANDPANPDKISVAIVLEPVALHLKASTRKEIQIEFIPVEQFGHDTHRSGHLLESVRRQFVPRRSGDRFKEVQFRVIGQGSELEQRQRCHQQGCLPRFGCRTKHAVSLLLSVFE